MTTEAPVIDPAVAAAAAPAAVVNLDPAAPAPAAAAAPVVEAAKPAAKGKDPEVYTYDSTGDAGLDMALEFVGRHGFNHDHPAVIAAGEGDFSQLRAIMTEKAIPGAEQYIKLMEDGHTRYTEKEKGHAENVGRIVAEVVGGAENWTEVQNWAKANVPQEVRTELNGLLVSEVGARAVALYLNDAYQTAAAAAGSDFPPTLKATSPNASAVTQGHGLARLSRAEFAEEAGKLNRKFGPGYQKTPEYQALYKRLA